MLPNFLIVGAAKAGTTSTYHYLKQHPEVYMSPVKEPKFLTSLFLEFPHNGPTDDEMDERIIKDFNKYRELFNNSEQYKAIGEASADNLYYYDGTIASIKEYLNKIKIIIILRNPIERAYSAYLHVVRDNLESLSFEEALEKENERKNKNWNFIWFFKDVGFYYRQVEAYLDAFGKERVKIFLFEELQRNALALMKEIYSFIGVDSSVVPKILRYEVTGLPRNKLLHDFLSKPLLIKKVVKYFVPKKTRERLILNLWNTNLKKPEISTDTRKHLIEVYQYDIKCLEKCIGRDLSSWLK